MMNMKENLRHTAHSVPYTKGRLITWADGYDRMVKLVTLGRESKLREATIQLAAIRPGEVVLDVGCGTGTLTMLAKTHAGHRGPVYGVDAAPEMIGRAQHKAMSAGVEVDFQVGLIEALAFPANTFDVVLSSAMFHHLPDELKERGLAEIYRVLKPDGRVLIMDIKRPANFIGRMGLALILHPHMRSGVQDLLTPMQAIGYTRIETGDVKFGPLGFVRGRRPVE